MNRYPVDMEEMPFETQDDVFCPTETSRLLIKACKAAKLTPGKLLDLGCGCGYVGIVLARLGLCKSPVFASDISKQAISLAKKNANEMSIDYIAKCGSLFKVWEDERFDVIIDDVAGISDDIARISPWYPPGVDCNAGRDGTKWIVKIIEQSRRYLVEGGTLIFPTLSLSNEDKILRLLKETYTSYTLIAKQDWFLPDGIASRPEIFIPLIDDGSIRCERKYGKWIWSTCIYSVHNTS